MRRGFVYLFVVVDWYSRRVLSWRLSNTLTKDFCIEAVEEAIERYCVPEIFNTDQGSTFTSSDFKGFLQINDFRICCRFKAISSSREDSETSRILRLLSPFTERDYTNHYDLHPPKARMSQKNGNRPGFPSIISLRIVLDEYTNIGC
jgi:transposase InsO family protein